MNTTRLGITLPLAVIVAGVAVAASSAAEEGSRTGTSGSTMLREASGGMMT
jgi:hypothetical protein